MKLAIEKRTTEKKRDTNRLRRDGKIPAVLYSNGNVGETITVDNAEFGALLRSIKKGALPTTVIALTDAEGKERTAIVKGIQYQPTTYNIVHLDFEELHDDARVSVKVPLRFTGVLECVGIKHGGVLRPVIRHVKVNCLPKDMPSEFVLDVQDLEIKGVRRLADIAMPEGVKALVPLTEVAVVIAKR